MQARRRRWAAALTIGAVLGAACGSDETGGQATEAGSDGTAEAAGGEVPDSPDQGVTADTIRLGWMGDATGPTAAAQAPHLHGAEAAVAWFNDNGGVLGRQLELLDRDDQYAAETAATNYSALVDDERVLALLGMGGSHISTALSPNVESDGIVVMGPTQTIDAQLENPWFFNNLAHYGDMADVAIAYLDDTIGLDDAVVAVANLEVPSGSEWDVYIQQELQDNGGTYAGALTINASAPDYPGLVTRLQQMVATDGVNALALHGSPATGLGVVSEMATQGVQVPIVGIQGIAANIIYEEGPESMHDMVHGVHSFQPAAADCDMCATIRDFVVGTEWEGEASVINFSHGWLDVMSLVQGMERAAASGELTRASLQEGMQGPIDTGGLSCETDYSASNHSPCAAPFAWQADIGALVTIDEFATWRDALDEEYGLFEG